MKQQTAYKKLSNAVGIALSVIIGKIFHRYSPGIAQFTITNKCNYKCNYCYGKYYERPGEDMPLKDVYTVIAELRKVGLKRLNLVGGEPLIRKDIGEIIDFAHSKGMEVVMTSNGSLVAKKLDVVKKLDLLCFSLDGSEENNALGRGKDSFKDVINSLDLCKKEGVKTQLSAVIHKHTIHDVDYLMELAEKYETEVAFTPLIGQIESDENSLLLGDEEEYRNVFKHLAESKRAGKNIVFSDLSYELAEKWPHYPVDKLLEKPLPDGHPECLAGKFFCIVDFDGKVYPCPQMIGNVKASSILDVGFKQALLDSQKHACVACAMPCSNDYNYFFGMNMKIWGNFLSLYLKRWFKG